MSGHNLIFRCSLQRRFCRQLPRQRLPESGSMDSELAAQRRELNLTVLRVESYYSPRVSCSEAFLHTPNCTMMLLPIIHRVKSSKNGFTKYRTCLGRGIHCNLESRSFYEETRVNIMMADDDCAMVEMLSVSRHG